MGCGPKVLHIVRHCEPAGQEPFAPLSERGKRQAETLCAFLARFDIERIVSSPFVRALESIQPLGACLGIGVETDLRLVERTLSAVPIADWRERLRESFQDLDLVIEDGESSQVAMERARNAVADVLDHPAHQTVVVTHGNLMALMLKTFEDSIGFELWERLTYPDVYSVTVSETYSAVERIWA